MTELELLEFWTRPGILWYYECCEVTICCLIDREKTASNIFTILSFESSKIEQRRKAAFRTQPNEWVSRNTHLAVVQYQVTIEEALSICEQFCNNTTHLHTPLGLLNLGELSRWPNVFVPVDSTVLIPLNRVIKNNFVGGSMIAEWHGKDNHAVEALTDKEIKKAVQRIKKIVPIDLLTISDRIGNIIVQFPARIAHCSLIGSEKSTTCDVVFDERSIDLQRYIIHVYTDHDRTLICTSSAVIASSHKMQISLERTAGPYRISVLDIQNNIPVLVQTTSLMNRITTNFQFCGNADTVRTIRMPNGSSTQIVINTNHTSLVEQKNEEWDSKIKQRRYREHFSELNRTKEFIRYGGKNRVSERRQALCDLRSLMNVPAQKRVCLWDPFLSANDLLETWYHTTAYGLELRAISSSRGINIKNQSVHDWKEEQRRVLLENSNQYGINLNWRMQHDSFGYTFHDRFLIVIDSNEGPRVWSLGTSVNSIGKKHHILQAVANPGYITDDFEELWNQLSDEECEVWSSRI